MQNFLVDSRPQSTGLISAAPRLSALVAPVDWPVDYRTDPADPFYEPRFAAPIPGSDVNPWRYVSSNPTNNPGEFDLWAEIVIGDEVIIIGNWEEN